MECRQEELPIRNEQVVEIDTIPNINNQKPIIVLQKEEFAKLVANLGRMNAPWICLKFNEDIYVIWQELIFLYSLPEQENIQNKRSI